jgi:3-hydroxyacyl-[acyl-carrier-protein] dehydratase
MMLKDDFYIIHDIQLQEVHLEAVIIFNADHTIFKGHFPNQPVVPGVCMIQIVKELFLLAHPNQLFTLSKANQVKFLQPVLPQEYEQVTFQLKWQEIDPGAYSIEALAKKRSEPVFKLSGMLTVSD